MPSSSRDHPPRGGRQVSGRAGGDGAFGQQRICFIYNPLGPTDHGIWRTDEAKLDEDAMWPTSFALKELGGAEEGRIAALVKKAMG